MALGGAGNVLGLIFRIKADGTEQTKNEIRSLRTEFRREVSDIKSSGTDAFLSIGNSAGFSTSQLANLQTGCLALVGGVTAVSGAVIGLSVALFELTKKTA